MVIVTMGQDDQIDLGRIDAHRFTVFQKGIGIACVKEDLFILILNIKAQGRLAKKIHINECIVIDKDFEFHVYLL